MYMFISIKPQAHLKEILKSLKNTENSDTQHLYALIVETFGACLHHHS